MKRALVCTVSWVLVVVCGIAAQEAGGQDAVGAKAGPSVSSVADPVAVEQKYGPPAPINEYKGMQEREEVFEFAEKPSVKKEGDRWTITFASKAKCDATVSIVNKEGVVVRHLASGVLGKNAPWPFQQDSLNQKLDWDGLTDTRKSAPAGCSVKVGLGLQAKFERNIWDVNHTGPKDYPVVLGAGKDGEMYVGCIHGKYSWGRVFGKDGKYLRTFWPPAATDLEKAVTAMGGKMVPTTWGDKVPVADSSFWCPGSNPTEWVERAKDLASGLAHKENGGVQALAKVMEKVCGLDPAKLERAPRPAAIPPEKSWAQHIANIFSKVSHLDVDPETEQLYAGSWTLFRFDGKTGDFDEKWFPKGELSMCEYAVAPEGLIYVRTGPYGKLMVRLDREGKLVPFKENTVAPNWPKAPWGWKPKFLPEGAAGIDIGMAGFSATQQNGMHVSADGRTIVTCLREFDKQWALDQKLPINLKGDWFRDTFISVYNSDGKLISANMAGEIRCGNGIGIDREGNLYSAFASLMPGGQRRLDGYAQDFSGNRITPGHGSLVKLRGAGGKYPMGGLVERGAEGAPLKVSLGDYSGPGQLKDAEIAGGLWAYGGLTCQSNRGCSCGHARIYLDRAARVFVPVNHLYSIMVLDSNGNRIARLGRYGNADDNDPKYGGIQMCWPRAVCASDTAMYVTDYGNLRILKAALSYAAEETVAVQ